MVHRMQVLQSSGRNASLSIKADEGGGIMLFILGGRPRARHREFIFFASVI